MYLKNSLILINEFFYYTKNLIRNLYLKSSFYNNKISKIIISNITYKPSLNILSCLVKYDKKKLKIEELDKENIWDNKLNFDIEVDGGINFSNSKEVISAGANILVSGTTIFNENNGDIKKNIETLRSM